VCCFIVSIVFADEAFKFKAIYESLALGLQQSAYASSLRSESVSNSNTDICNAHKTEHGERM